MTESALFGSRGRVAQSIEIIFRVLSSSIVILCDVDSIIPNGPTVFGNSFDGDSSAIRSDAVSAVAGRST